MGTIPDGGDWGTTQPAPNDGLEGWLDMLSGVYAPDINALDRQYGSLVDQLGFTALGSGLSTDSLYSNYGLDQAGLNLAMSGLGLDQAGLGIDRAGLGLDRADLGLAREGNQADAAYLSRIRALTDEMFGHDTSRIGFETGEQDRALKSDALVRGAGFAPGFEKDVQANTLRGLSDLQSTRIGYDREVAGLDRDVTKNVLESRGFDVDEQRIGLDEQRLDLAGQKLDQTAAKLGLDRQRLDNDLRLGLSNLGLDYQQSVSKLYEMLSDNDARQLELGLQILLEALGYANQGSAPPAWAGDLYSGAAF